MPIPNPTETMREIQIIVNHWNMNATPSWRAVEKIAALILEYQKQVWEENHK